MNLIVNNNPIIKLSTPIYKVKNGSQGEMRKNFIVCLAESPEFALGRMLKVSGQRCSALWTWPKPRLCSCFRNPGRTGNVRFPVPNLTGLCVAWEHPVRAGMPVSEREKEGRLFFYKKCLY